MRRAILIAYCLLFAWPAIWTAKTTFVHYRDYLNSPQAQADYEYRLEARIEARHGEEAVNDYRDGTQYFVGDTNDIYGGMLFGIICWPAMAGGGVYLIAGLLWAFADWLIKRRRKPTSNQLVLHR